ncbi:tyrosine-type recombinase/integrase [Nocardia bovistercoris]|uniref:Tyrosine-type recombinase/integrase n=1 Tax=Nocardia bovistercoris TaxID=2785916 RepID=A0A931IIS9_9NOCA|nr:tyrosine-type recombinase/integrase [Nocardia bovistercoris]MBH0780378.1 tyrosine-type recombinase/integrase [Nocardia bovistercoris]
MNEPSPVRSLRAGVHLDDAVTAYLRTVTAANTARSYRTALAALVAEFGADTDPALLDPDRVATWFRTRWDAASAQTFNVRLAALRAAGTYWREQGWLVGDPLVRLRPRSIPADRSRALTRAEIAEILGSSAELRERVLWHMLYETAARAEELLGLDIDDLDTANRCARVQRKGGAFDVVAWQTGTARLLPRLLTGRRTGPVFLTERHAKPHVATADIDPGSHRARLSYRRAAELFDHHTAGMSGGPYALHQLRHSRLTHAAEDGASTPMLMTLSGHTSVRSLTKYARPSKEALLAWQAGTDPAARRRR